MFVSATFLRCVDKIRRKKRCIALIRGDQREVQVNGSMKKLMVPLLATAAALAMAAGVAQAQQKKTIALVTNVAAAFWTIAGRGLEKAQKEHPDYDIQLIITNEGTAAGQRRELDDLLVRGVAGISISVDDAPPATEELNKVAAK